MSTRNSPTTKIINVVVLISGGGTNLQAIIDAVINDDLPIKIAAVISNRPNVRGLSRAAAAGIPNEVLDHHNYPDRESFDAALQQRIDAHQPDLVVLAGFMRIFTANFAEHYLGRMLNIHPSLLPKYPGLHTHQRAIEAGDLEHGVSVHFVTAELDGGPIIVQTKVPVLAGDTPEQLAQRVLQQEHIIFPMAIRWFAEGRLQLAGNRCTLDNELLPKSGHLIDRTR